MSESSWVSLVEHAIWPVVLLVLVLMLRRQIGDFLSAIGGRIRQVSVMSVTIDLAVATETAPSWRGIGGEDVRGLVSAHQVNDSYFDTLRQSLQVPGAADFFVVDLKSDGRDEWLTSRLYLFTYVLSRMKGVRSVVFTATRGDVARSFLGVAGTEEVLRALAAAQPWLRLARMQAEAQQVGFLPQSLPAQEPFAPDLANVTGPEDIEEWWHGMQANPLYFATKFLERVQWTQPAGVPDPDLAADWLKLPGVPGLASTWEHAAWITASDLTDGMLRGVVQADGYVLNDRSWSTAERVRAVAQAPGDFVARLSPSRRFERLIDRRALLEELGKATFQP
jgi:hypothetical protein